MNLIEYRQQFPTLTDKFYFNFGGQGIMPRPAFEAIFKAYEYIQEVGPFSLKANAWIAQQNALTRMAIANELGAAPETIALTENVTAGCNIALWGIDWKAGDRILMTDCEHPGVIAAVAEISRRYKVEVITCSILETLNEGDPVEVIYQCLTANTRLVILSHLLWNTGQVLPLEEIVEICHEYPHSSQPIQILVDAAQSAGSVSLNLTELKADYYAFTGHKWMCGPAGVGGLYISPEAFDRLNPTFIGWRSVEVDEIGRIINWKQNGQKFEIATSAYPQYEGLREAIATHQQWGNSQQRYQQICQLSEYLWRKLSNLDGINCLKNSPPEAGLVSFQMTAGSISHEELVKDLEREKFFLRTIADPICIRACVHYFNIPEEIDRLVEKIQEKLTHT
ncbi:MAG: aminotransferase class V-fold PLP-dependent enzyme [Xenococcaceae cyanobacterium]